MGRRRSLTPEDRELWARVAASAVPLHPPRPAPVTTAPLPTEPDRPAAAPAPAFQPPSFRLGQSAPSAVTARASQPRTPAQAIAAQPVRMDHKTHRRMTRGKLDPEARLDLHGMTLATAHPALIGFLLAARGRGLRLVLVITGKGRGGDPGPLPTRAGALRHQVPHWLTQAPLAATVQQVTPAHARHGGEGAYYVYLRRAP